MDIVTSFHQIYSAIYPGDSPENVAYELGATRVEGYSVHRLKGTKEAAFPTKEMAERFVIWLEVEEYLHGPVGQHMEKLDWTVVWLPKGFE